MGNDERLTQLITDIETLEWEKSNISLEINGLYQTAKSEGFDPKIMRKVITLRKMTQEEREELENLVTLYLNVVEKSNTI